MKVSGMRMKEIELLGASLAEVMNTDLVQYAAMENGDDLGSFSKHRGVLGAARCLSNEMRWRYAM